MTNIELFKTIPPMTRVMDPNSLPAEKVKKKGIEDLFASSKSDKIVIGGIEKFCF